MRTDAFCLNFGTGVNCGRSGVVRNHEITKSHKSRFRQAAAVLAVVFTLAAGPARAQSAGTYADLHDFGGTVVDANGTNGPDGEGPWAGVTFDSAGNMYGTAFNGGANGVGMVWEITASGTYKDLHDFGGTVTNANGASGPDGAQPYAGVTFDKAGNMYGTASLGGANGYVNGETIYGMVWEITVSGTYKDLHDFGGTVTNANGASGPDGYQPFDAVTFDNAGNLYGTAEEGGPNGGNGIVWEITASGLYKDLHDFGGTVTNANGSSGPDGLGPVAGVTFDTAGNMYGTALGGPNVSGSYDPGGVLWEITASGLYKDLHDFGGTVTNANGSSGPDGRINSGFEADQGGVTLGTAGNMYGTADLGGGNTAPNTAGPGMVWEMTASGVYKDIHDFGGTVTNADGSSGPDGANPSAGVTFDGAGDMYGTAAVGGANASGPNALQGMAWEIPASGAYRDIYDFGGTVTNADGTSGPNGGAPNAAVTFDSAGNVYSTAVEGGAYYGHDGDGIAWEIAYPPAPAPTINPSGGTFTSAQSVTITDGLSGAAIYYTTDGSTPTWNSALYAGPITVSANETIKAIAAADEYTNSPVASAAFTINLPHAPTPAISPNGGTFTSVQSVTITDSLSGAVIYYTTNGTTPTTSSPQYAGPITVSASETVNAIAVANGDLNSAVASASFQIFLPAAPAPTISPNGGTFTSVQSVTISDSVSGASIYYTTDGSTPTANSTLYAGPVTVSASETINAVAIASGYSNSPTASAAFTIIPQAPAPAISPNGGTFTSVQSVTITDSLGNAAIYYTTDGSTPTASSPLYTAPITVATSETISALAIAAGYTNSPVSAAVFTINLPPVATFSAGLQMISLPYSYPGVSLDTLFGYTGVKLAAWDEASYTYTLTPTPPANQIVLGQAYWVRFPQAVTVTLTGTSPPAHAPVVVSLNAGWNMVGDPYTTAVPLSSLIFNNGAETFAQATTGSNPLIGAAVWSYNTGSNAYAEATSLEPDQGCWVFAFFATDMDISE